MENLQLWEILVPCQMEREDGSVKPIRVRYHRIWDERVREIAGGLTVLKPAIGQWVNPQNVLYKERMIPVRIACTEDQIERIADMTAKYYNQQAVMFYKISEDVRIKNYS